MSQARCCTCNGANAKCINCRCARNNIACFSCYPGRHGRCQNVSSSLMVSSNNASSPPNEDLPGGSDTHAPETSTSQDACSQMASVVQKLRQCRSSIIAHIPKGSRYQFAKALANTIDAVISRKDAASWIRFVIFPLFCLRSPPHNGKKHTVSLATIINRRISSFESNQDIRELLSSLETASHSSRRKKSNHADHQLRKSVSNKINDGDVRGAVRLITSEDALAPYTSSVLSELQEKHPPKPPDRRPFPSPTCPPFEVSSDDVVSAIKSFPVGSSGGITRLRPQHLKETLRLDAGDQRERLVKLLTALTNALLSNSVPDFVRPVLFGANITALKKKSGGIRPIAVGDVFRRIACKCAMRRVEPTLSALLMPSQLGCGVRAGIDAAIHSTREKLFSSTDCKLFLKIDFQNAFNTIRRDHVAECLYKFAPELLSIYTASYSQPSFLTFGDSILQSDEGLQQGDPLAPAFFCLGLHDIISSLRTPYKIAYLDDVSLIGDLSTITKDMEFFIPACKKIGLEVNGGKCELTKIGTSNVDCSQLSSTHLPGLKWVSVDDATLLGAALGDKSLAALLCDFAKKFATFNDRLLALSAHDAFFLLRNCLYMPKLLHTLRTSPSFTRPDLLREIDNSVTNSLSAILNVKLDGSKTSQISLPTKLGGFGVCSAEFLAASAFLASLHAADATCQVISETWDLCVNTTHEAALSQWRSQGPSATVPTQAKEKQKSWSSPLHSKAYETLFFSSDEIDRTRLQACKAYGAGDWINVLPSSSLGLHLSDEQLRVAASVRLGAPVSLEHICVRCGSVSDSFGKHAFSCKRSTGRHVRHYLMNDTIDRALHTMQMPTRLEPNGLTLDTNLKPDGVSSSSWSHGKPLAWDVTCAHPLAQSWLPVAQRGVSAVATAVEAKKRTKYAALEQDFCFEPVSVETLGGLGDSTALFIACLGAKIAARTGDPKATLHLRQRLAIAIQIGNCACVAETLPQPGVTLPFNDF